jgi:hypothetical protein
MTITLRADDFRRETSGAARRLHQNLAGQKQIRLGQQWAEEIKRGLEGSAALHNPPGSALEQRHRKRQIKPLRRKRNTIRILWPAYVPE